VCDWLFYAASQSTGGLEELRSSDGSLNGGDPCFKAMEQIMVERKFETRHSAKAGHARCPVRRHKGATSATADSVLRFWAADKWPFCKLSTQNQSPKASCSLGTARLWVASATMLGPCDFGVDRPPLQESPSASALPKGMPEEPGKMSRVLKCP
jgi:hypothetical protein